MSDSIRRHDTPARLMHWLMAISTLILLVTGLLPVVGVDFNWVPVHWIAGLVLTLCLLFHILRSLTGGRLKEMLFRGRDIAALTRSGVRPGKYSLPQKLMHNAVALFGLGAVITGCLMLTRIDTPLWQRNPYYLAEQTWGIVYVVHGVSALVFLSLVMLHIYFSLRPEKAMYLKAMLGGRMARRDYEAEHDPALWAPKE